MAIYQERTDLYEIFISYNYSNHFNISIFCYWILLLLGIPEFSITSNLYGVHFNFYNRINNRTFLCGC